MNSKTKIGIVICDRYRRCAAGKCFRAMRNKEGAFSIGHYNYFYVRGNSHSVWSFYSEVIKYTKKWLNRGGQRKSYNWEKFKRVLENTGIPKPRPTEKKRLHQVALG